MYDKVMLPGTWIDRELLRDIDDYRCAASVSRAQAIRSLLMAGLGKAAPAVGPYDPAAEKRKSLRAVMVSLYPSQIERIEEFQHGAELPSRNMAIRSLVNMGLDTLGSPVGRPPEPSHCPECGARCDSRADARAHCRRRSEL